MGLGEIDGQLRIDIVGISYPWEQVYRTSPIRRLAIYFREASLWSLSRISRQSLRKQPNHLWIPAFAGMTEGLCLPIWDRLSLCQ